VYIFHILIKIIFDFHVHKFLLICLQSDIQISQRWGWWCRSSWMWHSVTRQMVSEVSNDHSTTSSIVKQYKMNWRYVPRKHMTSLTLKHSVTSRKTWILLLVLLVGCGETWFICLTSSPQTIAVRGTLMLTGLKCHTNHHVSISHT
jgi:hypothetical protein